MDVQRTIKSVLLGGFVLVSGCFEDVPEVANTSNSDTESGPGNETSADADPTLTTASTTGTPNPTSSSSGETTVDGTTSDGTTLDGTTLEDTTLGDTTNVADESSSSTQGSSTGLVEDCGDGEISDGETCDSANLAGLTCESLGFLSGELGCSDSCAFDFADCEAPQGMVFVPAGVFTMGSVENADEMPIREVTLDGYFIDMHEVTAAEYQACMFDGECEQPLSTANHQFDEQCNVGQEGRENHPVNCIGRTDSATYCAWSGKRLPTEAEWEKAARGVDARRYPWGDGPAPSSACNHAITGHGGLGCGMESTAQVGSVPMGASAYGAHDMAGNVWEWVSDYYAGTYDGAQLDNPTGPAGGNSAVLRGGGWFHSNTSEFTTTRRHDSGLQLADAFTGFRCVRPLTMPE